ncbi:Systemic RNA interference defective protein 5 [Caenorhabditis elegans]|uniref:Systemic RNA interference defective protein 5 n=1 Tax=Caenorhabditis elegans TaxID=6239 RepID=SID5_CAEEL|nr:Systemic RNA interference defective protein 5 [Caenorhabditis elegans]Q19443.1 RecName: Full=Systemic RNA interference defective protein 5 [Caenorhabditis elegans]CCD64773.1 Systemic RNA interference defective protein 5 [Caenorhabditis elegans]|eukprot:NP_509168.1 Systemic RNA interference defective protein 5 [Caenorhabditis elegans]
MPSKNCAKNLHACQWERDIALVFLGLMVLFNIGQVVYMNRARLYRLIRRGAEQIPADDEEPIIGIRD